MHHRPRPVRFPIFAASLLAAVAALAGAPAEAAETGDADAGVALRVAHPADGKILDTREPALEVCLTGADDAVRASFEATLDGEAITDGFAWSGDCARWRPSDGWAGFGKRHAWSDPPWEVEGWEPELREGAHDLEVRVTAPSGEAVVARSRFRVETERRTATLAVGFPDLSLETFEGPFADARLLDGRFGSRRASTIAKGAGVLRYADEAFSLGAISSSLAGDADPGATETTLWRLGAGRREGYGYRTGASSFVAPYHGTSVFLADLDVRGDGPADAGDAAALRRFARSGVRVGSAFEGGVAIAFGRSLTLDLGYEQIAVYPHYVVWEAAGSGAVHGLALAVADGVSRQVARRSPRAAPVVSFLLRNAISYAVHHQRRDEVNWPFGGDPALVYDGVRVSLTFAY